MIRLSIQLRDETRAAFRSLSDLLGDLTPVMQEIGEYETEATKARFRAGRGPAGIPWARKSPATLAAVAARGDRPDPRPLFGPSRRLSNEVAYRASRNAVEIGSSLVYSAAQQFGAAKGAFGRTKRGAPIPWGRIPARPFLGLDAADESAIGAILRDAIGRAIGELG